MKKIISILLCAVLVFSTCAFAVSASSDVKGKITDYPVIIVPGYSSTNLYYGDSLETGESVWGLNWDHVLDRVLARAAELGIGLGVFAWGNADYITDVLAEEMSALFEKLRCNPDGTSAYELHLDYTEAKDKNSAYLIEKFPDGKYQQETKIAAEIAEYIGYENIYNFASDFRMGSEFCAGQLDDFIQSVKKHTGKKKVNLFAVSHGGQVTATYLALYGYKNDVDNAVLTVPAIGGAGIAYDAMTANIKFDEECLLRFIENGTMTEENYNWLVKAQQLGFVDKLLNTLFPKLIPTLGYWGSLWDFIQPDKYESAKAQLLDKEESARLIKISDRFHYEILPSIPEKLQKCIKRGMNISIVSGTGTQIVTGMPLNSDGIISTTASTGATCAPAYERFADGYVQKNPCGGKDKVSPAMDIDASTAYLPDNTWFVDGLFHGMTNKDIYSRNLMLTLLLTDRITNVYSDKNYPQFKYSTNASHTVHAAFNGCDEGILTSDAKNLVVTNTSANSKVRIAAVMCDKLDLEFKVNPHITLNPGEKVEIPFTGDIPAVSNMAVGVTVYYVMDTVTPVGYRTQTFKLANGKPVAEKEGYESIEAGTGFDYIMTDSAETVLRKLGLWEFFSMIHTIYSYWVLALVF